MIILEIMMLVGVVALGLYASVSDCLYGIIKNKIILAFLTYAVLLNSILQQLLCKLQQLVQSRKRQRNDRKR